MSDDNNITVLPTQPDKMKGTIEQIKRDFETILEFRTLQAKIMRAQYEAYVKAGFAPAEALQLVATMNK